MRRQQGRKPLDHGEGAGGTAGLLQDAGAVFAQEQNGSGLRGFVGVFPDPCAVLIARLEGGCHRLAQQMRIERKPAFKRGNKVESGSQELGRFRVLRDRQARERDRLRGRRGHGKVLSNEWGRVSRRLEGLLRR